MSTAAVDLPVDLNSEDDTGCPWGLMAEAPDPSRITEGAWIVVGSPLTQAAAQVTSITGGVVHVRPLPGQV